MKKRVAVAGLPASVIVALAGIAPRAAYAGEFERVYHSTETTLPGFSGAFEGFDGVNVVGSKVVFRARGTGYQGIFEYDGSGYRNLIDTATVVPGIASPLAIVRESAVSGGSMAFTGRMPPSGPGPEDGIYVQDASGVTRLEVSQSQMNPVYTSEPIHFMVSTVAYADGRVVFRDPSLTGGYYESRDGVLSALVYRGQPIPGTDKTFQRFEDSTMWAKGDTTVFIAGPGSFEDMIWKATPAGMTKIAAEGEQIPGEAIGVVFTDLDSPRMNERGQVAFLGAPEPFEESVFLLDGGGLWPVVHASMTWNGERVQLAASSGNFAFGKNFIMVGAIVGSGSGSSGFLPEMFLLNLYSGEISMFLERGDIVDGRTVATSRLYPYGLDGDRVVVGIRFSDGTSGLYATNAGVHCAVDLNDDGVVDFGDYLAFLNLFDEQDPAVDFNQDGFVDFADYLEFLNLFEAGC